MALDLYLRRFGRLVAVSRVLGIHEKGRHRYWLCRCDCGKTVVVRGSNLTAGMQQSCGCLRSDASRARALARKAAGDRLFTAVPRPTPVLAQIIAFKRPAPRPVAPSLDPPKEGYSMFATYRPRPAAPRRGRLVELPVADIKSGLV